MRTLTKVVAILLGMTAAETYAQCPMNKTEVTIINKQGNVHVICVASAAIPTSVATATS